MCPLFLIVKTQAKPSQNNGHTLTGTVRGTFGALFGHTVREHLRGILWAPASGTHYGGTITAGSKRLRAPDATSSPTQPPGRLRAGPKRLRGKFPNAASNQPPGRLRAVPGEAPGQPLQCQLQAFSKETRQASQHKLQASSRQTRQAPQRKPQASSRQLRTTHAHCTHRSGGHTLRLFCSRERTRRHPEENAHMA